MTVRRPLAIASFITLGLLLSGCTGSGHGGSAETITSDCSAAWQNLAATTARSTGATSLSSVGAGDYYPTLTACGGGEWLSQLSQTSIGVALSEHGSSLQTFLDGMCAQAPSARACQR